MNTHQDATSVPSNSLEGLQMYLEHEREIARTRKSEEGFTFALMVLDNYQRQMEALDKMARSIEVPFTTPVEEREPELDVATLRHVARTMREAIGDEIPVGPAQTGAFTVTRSWAAWMDEQAALRMRRL